MHTLSASVRVRLVPVYRGVYRGVYSGRDAVLARQHQHQHQQQQRQQQRQQEKVVTAEESVESGESEATAPIATTTAAALEVASELGRRGQRGAPLLRRASRLPSD
jgi:transcription initiation factor TFIID subunit TAF12